jgi:hypothetical protein
MAERECPGLAKRRVQKFVLEQEFVPLEAPARIPEEPAKPASAPIGNHR